MKKVLLFILLMLFMGLPVFAEDTTSLEGEPFFNETKEQILSGEFTLNPVELFQKGVDSLFSEIKKSRAAMLQILVIAAASGVLGLMQKEDSASGEAGFFACFSLSAIAAMQIFSETLGYGREVIGAMTDFITKLSPLFAALMVSAGAVTSAAAFHPVLSGAVYLISVLVEQCFVPLAYFGAILGIAGKISPRVQISNATRLIRSVSKWMMTAALTLFTGITALYGFSAPVLDGVAVKTVKFAVGSFVPVVGGLLADTVETVLSGTKLMKNAVGTAGILAVAAICIVPVLKIFVMHFMLRLCAAAAEPLTDRRISEMLSDLADSVMTIYIMVLTVCMLFTICIGIIMSATT